MIGAIWLIQYIDSRNLQAQLRHGLSIVLSLYTAQLLREAYAWGSSQNQTNLHKGGYKGLRRDARVRR